MGGKRVSCGKQGPSKSGLVAMRESMMDSSVFRAVSGLTVLE